jgi:hypothetical protein
MQVTQGAITAGMRRILLPNGAVKLLTKLRESKP